MHILIVQHNTLKITIQSSRDLSSDDCLNRDNIILLYVQYMKGQSSTELYYPMGMKPDSYRSVVRFRDH